MFNVGGGEMFAILLLALLVLGPERLPKAMGQVGRYVGQLRRMSSGFQDELRRAMDPENAPFRPGEESHPIPDEVKVVNAQDTTAVEVAPPAAADPSPEQDPRPAEDGDPPAGEAPSVEPEAPRPTGTDGILP